MNAALKAGGDNVAVRPFRVNVPEAELSELMRRVSTTRWPERETVPDKSQGVPLATIQTLAQYWATKYDWRRVERRINALPNFTTEINGLDIHFVHVRSKHESALPLILTHGWPGSITHQLKIVDPLINPTLYGGTAADAFRLVFPAMPGFGYSGKPTETGWDPVRIARAWGVLMKRLGYERYVAQGGDWGALVTEQMAVQTQPGLLGIHTNMPGAVPSDLDAAAYAGARMPSGLSVEEEQAYEQLRFVYRYVVQYASYMASRPQRLKLVRPLKACRSVAGGYRVGSNHANEQSHADCTLIGKQRPSRAARHINRTARNGSWKAREHVHGSSRV